MTYQPRLGDDIRMQDMASAAELLSRASRIVERHKTSPELPTLKYLSWSIGQDVQVLRRMTQGLLERRR